MTVTVISVGGVKEEYLSALVAHSVSSAYGIASGIKGAGESCIQGERNGFAACTGDNGVDYVSLCENGVLIGIFFTELAV